MKRTLVLCRQLWKCPESCPVQILNFTSWKPFMCCHAILEMGFQHNCLKGECKHQAPDRWWPSGDSSLSTYISIWDTGSMEQLLDPFKTWRTEKDFPYKYIHMITHYQSCMKWSECPWQRHGGRGETQTCYRPDYNIASRIDLVYGVDLTTSATVSLWGDILALPCL